MMINVEIICLLISLQVSILLARLRCTEMEIKTCIRPLEEFAEKSGTIFPNYSDQDLERYCSSCDSIERCLAPIKPDCTDLTRQSSEGIEQTCAFLCGDGKDAYKAHRECFGRVELNDRGKHCNETYHMQMERAYREDMDKPTQERRKQYCRDVFEFMDCVKSAVTSFCGQEAASWVHRVNVKYFSPVLDDIGCQPVSNVGIAIIFGTALGLFSVMLVIIITSIMCRRKQRQQSSTNSMGVSSRLNTFSGIFSDKKTKNDNDDSLRRKSETTYVSTHANSPKKSAVCPKPESENLLRRCEEGHAEKAQTQIQLQEINKNEYEPISSEEKQADSIDSSRDLEEDV